jgi:hypothetical protein
MFLGKVSPFLISLTLIVCSLAQAQVRKPADASGGIQQIVYYAPEARKLFLATVPGFKAGITATEKVLMVKTLDRQNGRFKEVACILDGKQPAYISPVYMKVEGSRISAISDTPDFEKPNKLTGMGSLSGKDWDWNFLSFSMNYQTCPSPQCSSRVADVNFVVRGQRSDGVTFEQLIARKQLFLADGSPFELYDVEMDKISLDRGKVLYGEMGCPEAKSSELFDAIF